MDRTKNPAGIQNLIICIPVYNDWQAVDLLLAKLDHEIAMLDSSVSILIVDDGSTETVPDKLSSVFSNIDKIEIGPQGERLFAASRQNKTVEIITLDFIHEINTLGSPSKGLDEAPVVIAVFSDFQ